MGSPWSGANLEGALPWCVVVVAAAAAYDAESAFAAVEVAVEADAKASNADTVNYAVASRFAAAALHSVAGTGPVLESAMAAVHLVHHHLLAHHVPSHAHPQDPKVAYTTPMRSAATPHLNSGVEWTDR